MQTTTEMRKYGTKRTKTTKETTKYKEKWIS
jgi:hypothetical protein